MSYTIKPWQDLTIQDDYMFKLVMRRKPICKRMLEKILHVPIRDIRYSDDEKTMKFQYEGKGIRLDVYVADDKGTVYDIEMQVRKPSDDGLYLRTRYYQSMIDMGLLEEGADYDELNPSYIIFICPFEPFDKGRHIYTFRNVCLEDTSLELRDGATKIFLSSVGTANDVAPDVKRFLEYVNGILSNDAFVQEIDQEIKRVKKLEEERVRYMTYAMKMQEERKEGIKEGREAMQHDLALKMLKDHKPIHEIVRYTELTENQIRKIVAENSNVSFGEESGSHV